MTQPTTTPDSKGESTSHLLKALAKKVHWWDYPVFILWIVGLWVFGDWYSTFSASGYTETAAATFGLEIFVVILVLWPILRIGLHFALKGRKH